MRRKGGGGGLTFMLIPMELTGEELLLHWQTDTHGAVGRALEMLS